jgi:hypothetical protein
MAAPFPPQGNQQQHTERPIKIYGEQYVIGQPLPVGVSTDVFVPVFPNGEPRVYLAGGVVRLIQPTDWVISSRYTGQPIEVISAEEFLERFGPSE